MCLQLTLNMVGLRAPRWSDLLYKETKNTSDEEEIYEVPEQEETSSLSSASNEGPSPSAEGEKSTSNYLGDQERTTENGNISQLLTSISQ